MRAQESVQPFNNAAAGTSATFFLQGGRYVLEAASTGTGTVTLNALASDGVTFVPVVPAVGSALTASGTGIYDLPPGQYNVVVATLTANYITLTRVPGE